MKAIIVLANGFEEIEALTIVDVLRRGNVDISMLALDDSSLDVEGAHGIGVVADGEWDDEEVDASDVIILPGGGRGMEALKADSRVLSALRRFDENDKFIAAICAAPAVLQEAGVLSGRKAVCYPGMESHIKDAVVQKGANVVRDGTLITGSGPATAMEFALGVLEMLEGPVVRKKVADGLLFKG